jgi:hypothetical protein
MLMTGNIIYRKKIHHTDEESEESLRYKVSEETLRLRELEARKLEARKLEESTTLLF